MNDLIFALAQGDHFKMGHPWFREHSLSQTNSIEVFCLPPSYLTIFLVFDTCENIILKKLIDILKSENYNLFFANSNGLS